MILSTPLRTERLLLRTLTGADAGASYLAWLADPDVTRCLEVRFAPPQNLDALRAFVAEANASSDELMLGIFLPESERHIGNIKLGPVSWRHSRGDIGFLIGERSEWGKGYASEAIEAVARYAFGALKLAKVTAGCYASNQGSARALQKAGFLLEARQRAHWSCGSGLEDGLLFGRFSSDSMSAGERRTRL